MIGITGDLRRHDAKMMHYHEPCASLYFSPTPEVFIYSAHRPLPEDRTSVEGYGTELVIRDVREEDQGVYMCVGENEVGRSQYGFVVLEVECEYMH